MTTEKQPESNIAYLVRKRKNNFDYLKRAHQGKVHWMNVIKLSKKEINSKTSPQKLKKRIRRWFYLGFSVGTLLELPTGISILRALFQLLEEYDHWIAHGERSQATFNFNFQHAVKARPQEKKRSDDYLRANFVKVNKQVVYQYFRTPYVCTVREDMDFCEVLYSLCDVMSLVYAKFLDDTCDNMEQQLLQVDRKVKAHILTKISQDLTMLATPLLENQLKLLLTHMFDDVPQAKNVDRKRHDAVNETE